MSDKRNFLAGLLVGGVLGAAFALLYAPRPGDETRTRLRERGEDIRGRVKGKTDEVVTRARSKMEDAAQRGRTLFEEKAARLREALGHTGSPEHHDALRRALEDLEKDQG